MGKTSKAKTSRYGEPTPAEEQPLIDEIIAAPDDDAPRLILADWLEERGDSRAEFIRVQCRLAKMDGSEPEYDALEDREAELLAKHRAKWLKRQPNLAGIGYGVAGYLRDFSLCEWDSERTYFVRGMVELATPKTFLDFRKQAKALAERTVARELRFMPLTSRQFSEFLASEFSVRVTGLMLPISEGTSEGVELANSACVARLQTLMLSAIGDQELAALLPKLQRVKRLCLEGGSLDGAKLLAGWKGLANVQSLYFDLTDEDKAAALAESPYLSGLRTLRAGYTHFAGDRVVKTLADAKGLRGLRGLCLSGAELTQESLARLAAFPQLRRLSLHMGRRIDDAAARSLAALSTLRRLDVRATRLDSTAIEFLKKSLPQCQILSGEY